MEQSSVPALLYVWFPTSDQNVTLRMSLDMCDVHVFHYGIFDVLVELRTKYCYW